MILCPVIVKDGENLLMVIAVNNLIDERLDASLIRGSSVLRFNERQLI